MKPEDDVRFWAAYDWSEYDLFRRGWQIPEDPPERMEIVRRPVPMRVPKGREAEPIHVRARWAMENAETLED